MFSNVPPQLPVTPSAEKKIPNSEKIFTVINWFELLKADTLSLTSEKMEEILLYESLKKEIQNSPNYREKKFRYGPLKPKFSPSQS